MKFTPDEIHEYETNGFVTRLGMLSEDEVDGLRDEVEHVRRTPPAGTTLESDHQTVRALHGCHRHSARFSALTALPQVAEPAIQVLGGDVYVYQFKINIKAAFAGEVWKWHQDYVYWLREDGMPRPAAMNALIYLDDVSEFNGPLMMVPRSHVHGAYETTGTAETMRGQPAWTNDVSADLKYTLPRERVSELVKAGGIVAPKGPRGSMIFFHPNVAHASAPNLSPFDRVAVIITYNRTDNVPLRVAEPRPEFLVSRDVTPVVPRAVSVIA